MLAGRDLDILIAEKVFGLEVVITRWGKQKQYSHASIGQPNYHDDQGQMILSNPLPNYSTDISAAMEVFEHLRKSHEWCCLKISSDYNYNWRVTLTQAEKEDPDHKPDIIVDGEEELPLAICLAALKSVEFKAKG